MEDEAERLPGQPYRASPHDRQRVKDLLAAHLPLDRIADVIGIGVRTLNEKFKAEILAAGVRVGHQGHVPTEKDRVTVKAMASIGIPQADIARAMRIHESTLKKHYLEELETAAIEANTRVGANMYRAATGDPTKPATVTAGIWWSKNRMGWADKNEIDATIRRDPNELSDAELERIARRGGGSAAIEAEGEE